jgi:hypothetical protein
MASDTLEMFKINLEELQFPQTIGLIISFIFLILFYIVQTIDLNTVLKKFKVDTVIKPTNLILYYRIGYVTFIINYLVSFIVFVLLIIIIACIIMSFIIPILDAKPTIEEYYGHITETIKSTIKTVLICFASFLYIPKFTIIFLLLIPALLFTFYFYYGFLFYNPKDVEKDKDNISNNMNTSHMYLFFLFVSTCIFGFLYLLYEIYYILKNNRN